ncbi:MAG TPA: DUF1707 domain-containing protein [Streptosporangiaceae bacterium]
MPTGSQDPAEAGRDQLRVGHAEREQVIEMLKTAFVDGRLIKDEFDARAGRALAARTHADLAVLTADIPAVPAADVIAWPSVPAAAEAARPPAPARSRPLAKASVASGGLLGFAFGLILFAANVLDPHGLGNPYHPWSSLCATVAMVATIAAVLIFAHGVGTSAEQRRSRRQLPPRPRPGGHALEAERRAGTGHHPVPPGLPTDQTRADLRACQSQRPIPARADRAPRGLRPTPEGA